MNLSLQISSARGLEYVKVHAASIFLSPSSAAVQSLRWGASNTQKSTHSPFFSSLQSCNPICSLGGLKYVKIHTASIFPIRSWLQFNLFAIVASYMKESVHSPVFPFIQRCSPLFLYRQHLQDLRIPCDVLVKTFLIFFPFLSGYNNAFLESDVSYPQT